MKPTVVIHTSSESGLGPINAHLPRGGLPAELFYCSLSEQALIISNQ